MCCRSVELERQDKDETKKIIMKRTEKWSRTFKNCSGNYLSKISLFSNDFLSPIYSNDSSSILSCVNEANSLIKRLLSGMFQQNNTIRFPRIDHTSSSQLLGIAFMTYTHSNNICPGCASACNGQHKTVNIMGSHLDLMGQIGSKKGPLVLGLGIRLATLVRSEVNLSL
jgi:hypothetical protein